MSDVRTTELDFFEYKANLKEFLRTQDRFKDYDFEGSNMSVLLDVMAYNLYQHAFYGNMVAGEMFLDSAVLGKSVQSHAKTLGYTPRSRKSALAMLDFSLNVSDITVPFVTIPAKTKFTGRGRNGESFDFYTKQSRTVFRTDGVFVVNCLEVFEGKYAEEYYEASGKENFICKISNERVDTDSIRVLVREPGQTKETEFKFTPNIYGVSKNDNVFYLQCTDDHYEITFGRGIFGKQPTLGQIVRVEYRVSNGEDANGMTDFSASSTVGGYTTTKIAANLPSSGGAEREGTEEIRFYAPKAVQVQDRAVTEKDYVVLLKSNFPDIQAVSVVGGENLDPPRYGKVAVYVDMVGADGISNNQKNKLSTFLKKAAPLGIDPVIMSPEFMFVEVITKVSFDLTKSEKSDADIRKLVSDSIQKYSDDNLNDFGRTVRFSKLLKVIDDADAHILSNDTTIRGVIDVVPDISKPLNTTVRFDRAIKSDHGFPAVTSTSFTVDGRSVYIQDNGAGVLQTVRSSNDGVVIVNKNVGTVDYETGRVDVKDINIQALNNGFIKFHGNFKDRDIDTPRNKIVTIRQEDVEIVVSGKS